MHQGEQQSAQNTPLGDLSVHDDGLRAIFQRSVCEEVLYPVAHLDLEFSCQVLVDNYTEGGAVGTE